MRWGLKTKRTSSQEVQKSIPLVRITGDNLAACMTAHPNQYEVSSLAFLFRLDCPLNQYKTWCLDFRQKKDQQIIYLISVFSRVSPMAGANGSVVGLLHSKLDRNTS